MDKKLFLVVLMASMAWWVGCSEGTIETAEQDFGYDYFPLEVGNFREYRVLEVNFLAAGPDTSRYQLREELTDSIVNGDQVVYTLERSVRPNAQEEWELDSVWTARITTTEAIQVENNIPIVKIAFPVLDGQIWDSNALNPNPDFPYASLFAPSDSLDDNALLVLIKDIPENIVLKDERSEFYARGIGLVRRDFETLNFCTVDCDNRPEITSGRILDQRLIAHGKVD